MGRARGWAGFVLPWVRAKRKLNPGLTRSVCPQEWQLRARWAKPCVTQTGRGARHNDPSRLADHQAKQSVATGQTNVKALLCSIAQQFTPVRLPRSRRLDACSTLNYSGGEPYSSASPRNASRNAVGASQAGSMRFAASEAFCASCAAVWAG